MEGVAKCSALQSCVPTRNGRNGTKGRVDDDGRECSTCGVWKPWDQFYRSAPAQPGGRMSSCIPCRRERHPDTRTPEEARRYHLARKFGITPEQFDWLLALQESLCALCDEPEIRVNPQSGQVQSLGIDHDHECEFHKPTKACVRCIRGLLCDHCNLLIGKAEAKPLVAIRFTDYLLRRPFLEGGDA